jgi:hypothetical protein
MQAKPRGGETVTLVTRARGYAQYVLAAIRFVNGALALFAPSTLARRLEVDTKESPGILYFERLFGIRTILIALDLVTGDAQETQRAIRAGRIIHASDSVGAALAGLSGNLKTRPAVMTTAISLVNLLLACVAKPLPKGPAARVSWIKRLNPFGG